MAVKVPTDSSKVQPVPWNSFLPVLFPKFPRHLLLPYCTSRLSCVRNHSVFWLSVANPRLFTCWVYDNSWHQNWNFAHDFHALLNLCQYLVFVLSTMCCFWNAWLVKAFGTDPHMRPNRNTTVASLTEQNNKKETMMMVMVMVVVFLTKWSIKTPLLVWPKINQYQSLFLMSHHYHLSTTIPPKFTIT